MNRFIQLTCMFVFTLVSFLQAAPIEPQVGVWRATIPTPAGTLPFNFEVLKNGKNYTVFIINGTERLEMDKSYMKGDSIHIPMSLFDAEIVAKVSKTSMDGYWKKMRSNFTFIRAKFRAEYGKDYRFFAACTEKNPLLMDKYSVVFISEDGKDSTKAVGLFKNTGNIVEGTFLTSTGDYRYLAGNTVGDSLKLSCFDGNHLFLFKAKIEQNQLKGGVFCSNAANIETWNGIADTNAALPDEKSLTYLKAGFESIDFSFPDSKGKIVSLNDTQYRGKVKIVQIMGSWCPNCMDETKFLAPWYLKNKNRGVEIICLAYEKSTDPSFAYPKINQLKARFGVQYDVLVAGTNDKEEASRTLPMLNRVIGFPTTIFIDKNNKVREIHTGFSGPGTGKYYDKFVSDFNLLIDKLLAE